MRTPIIPLFICLFSLFSCELDPLHTQLTGIDFNASIALYTVSFTTTLDGAQEYNWDFGDGNFSNEQNPEHTYEQSGDYEVRLLVVTADGAGAVSKIITVNPEEITINDLNFNTISTIDCKTLIFSSNYPNAITYNWDFGDGTTSTQATPQHTYIDDGSYEVRLNILTTEGAGLTNKTVNISAAELPTYHITYPSIEGYDIIPSGVGTDFYILGSSGFQQNYILRFNNDGVNEAENGPGVSQYVAYYTPQPNWTVTLHNEETGEVSFQYVGVGAVATELSRPNTFHQAQEAILTQYSNNFITAGTYYDNSSTGIFIWYTLQNDAIYNPLPLPNVETTKVSIDTTTDGSVIVAALVPGSCYVAKYDASGQMLWETNLPDISIDGVDQYEGVKTSMDIKTIDDKRFILGISGRADYVTSDPGANPFVNYLIQMDETTENWRISLPNAVNIAHIIHNTSEETYLVAGNGFRGASTFPPFMAELDSNGNILVHKEIFPDSDESIIIEDMVLKADNDFLLLGNLDGSLHLISFDCLGNF